MNTHVPGRHTREMPDQWPGLLQDTADIIRLHDQPLDEGRLLAFEQAVSLHERVNQIDDGLEIEQLMYYALGLGICQKAIMLSDPEIRETTVQQAAQALVEGHTILGGDRNGLRIREVGRLGACFFQATSSDFGALASCDPFLPISQAAVNRLDLEERAAASTLAAVVTNRRNKVDISCRTTTSMTHYAETVGSIMRGNLAAFVISNTADAAASTIIRGFLEARSNNGQAALVADVISEDELRSLNVDRIGIGAACLRIDEFFQAAVGNGPEVFNKNGKQLEFQKAFLGSEPEPVKEDANGTLPTLRQERLTCPALQTGLIPVMLEIVPEIIIRADRHIREEYGQRVS